MPSLADRVLSALPSFEEAPLAKDMAERLRTDEPHVRQAFERLETEGRAKIVRRGRGLHLVSADYPGLICAVCRAEFTRGKKSKRRACSRECWISLGWRESKDREARVQLLREAHRTPESRAKKTEVNRRRWADPKQHERLSEWNKRRWADPYTNAAQAVAIQKVRLQPEKRRIASERIKARWDDPAGREKLIEGMHRAHNTPEHKAKLSKLMSERWKDPIMREKMIAANREKNQRRSAAAKAKKQSADA